jgi:hypothetical protein
MYFNIIFPFLSRGSVVVKALCYKPEGRASKILSKDYVYNIYFNIIFQMLSRGSVVIKALHYKPEGHEFYTRWGDFFLNLPNPCAIRLL